MIVVSFIRRRLWKLKATPLIYGIIFLFCLAGVFVLPPGVFAAFSFSVKEINPVKVESKSQEISVKIQVNSLPAGDSYFRAGVDNGSTYIGYIKNNNGDWVKLGSLSADKENDRCKNYFKISTDGEYTLTVKVGEDNAIQNGSHVVKAHRFTSSCGSSTVSGETPDQTVNINFELPSPTPTATPTPTIISKASYKIKEVKDSGGKTVSSVQIYIDDNYTHHYAPETISFCPDCEYNFGTHVIGLKKSGFNDWKETKTFNPGDSFEVNPVMQILISPTPTPTPSPTPMVLPSPTKIILKKPVTIATPEATIAGLTLAILGTYSAETVTPAPPALPEPKNKDLISPLLITAGGLLSFLGVLSFVVVKYRGGV